MNSSACPICNGQSALISAMPARLIRENLTTFLGRTPPAQSEILDYEFRRCAHCDLEFFDPMTAGDAHFYDWITGIETYYPNKRWEWGLCVDLLKSCQPSGVLLDVGCGTGAFLGEVARSTRWRVVGLDLCQESVDICRQKGLEAYQGKLEDSPIFAENAVDVVSLWHLLEHVDNPLLLLKRIKTQMRPGGRVFFSVPLSPMSSEASGLDPLNLAPHHLTRWSSKALSELAKTLGFETEIFMPRAGNWIARSTRSLSVHAFPPFLSASRTWKVARLLGYIFTHPIVAVNDMILQLQRPRLAGRTLPDVVLVCMSMPLQPANANSTSESEKPPVTIRFAD
jgi:2-polyprenyl-3-methyl-5-hydroxy-6-metoxy-1,4-benzoquinol methylase